MNKTIVTHMSPDLDAAMGVWLIHRFLPDWEGADVSFVPAGKTLNNENPDGNEDIMHVDTGLGKFDHHQTNEETCASELVLTQLIAQKLLDKETHEVLTRMVAITCDDDHFKDIYRDQPDSDIYDFLLSAIMSGARGIMETDHEVVELMETLLDCILKTFINKIRAERELAKGFEFESPWGKTLAIETDNRETSNVAQKKGFHMVISKSKNGQVRIKLRPDVQKDLQELYNLVKAKDPDATWFYHASGHMLLNGSSKNPDMVPSTLTLRELIDLVESGGEDREEGEEEE